MLSLALSLMPSAKANLLPDAIAVGYGESLNEDVQMGNSRVELHWSWMDDVLDMKHWRVNTYFDASVSHWESSADQKKVLTRGYYESSASVTVLAISPVIRFERPVSNWSSVLYRSWRWPSVSFGF